MTHKTARAGVTIQKELGALIDTHLSDPRLPDMVSVTKVDLAPDLSTARVYISTPLGGEERDLAVEALRSASGRLGRELQSRIRIRRMPRLIFAADDTLERGEDLDDMIDRALDEDRRLRTRRSADHS